VGKGHRVDNNVKSLLTFSVPIMRQMETTSSIKPVTANVEPRATNTETDNHHEFRLAFGDMKKNPNFN
jgi:hypothetical protein